MKFKWSVAVPFLLTLGLVGGCGTIGTFFTKLQQPSQSAEISTRLIKAEQERLLAGALEYLRKGKEQNARALLERICEAPPLAGVTDDALFRLALLSLRDDSGKGVKQTQELLDRLIDEFPRSIWAFQAAPLASYLSDVKSLRDRQRELKTLRDLNLSLNRDNRDLRQTLERLKNLDIELEQKIKR